MTPFDPLRPRTAGGIPAWRDAPMLVLPSLFLTPDSVPGQWEVKFMFPSGEHSNAFHWVGKLFNSLMDISGDSELELFLQDWADGPEECVKKWLGLDPPSGKWWRLPSREAADAELETDMTMEEMGL